MNSQQETWGQQGNWVGPKGLGVQVVAVYPATVVGKQRGGGKQENPTGKYLSLSLVSLAGFWCFWAQFCLLDTHCWQSTPAPRVLSPPPPFSWAICFSALCLPPVVTAQPHKESTGDELLTYHTAMLRAKIICSLFCPHTCKNIII